MVKITESKGFHMSFENGLTISVQFGWGNYCSNRNSLKNDFKRGGECAESETAEIAIWDESGEMYEFDGPGDKVCGHLSVDEVAQWIDRTRLAKNLFDLKSVYFWV